MYEGRTRGKRMKYTYSDDEDMFYSDSTGNRRSARNTGANTPAETGTVTTSSGRQIRAPPRLNMVTGESAPGSVQGDGSEFGKEDSAGPSGRPTRSTAANHGTNGWGGTRSRRNTSADTDDGESEAEFGDDEEDAHVPEESEDEDEFDEDEAMVEDDLDDQPQSLVVKLSVTPPKLRTALAPINQAGNTLPTPEAHDSKANGGTSEGSVVEMHDAPIQDSISVADPTSKATPTPSRESTGGEKRSTPAPPERAGEAQPHITPAIPATSLAFRGSPEKLQAQPLPPVIGVAGRE